MQITVKTHTMKAGTQGWTTKTVKRTTKPEVAMAAALEAGTPAGVTAIIETKDEDGTRHVLGSVKLGVWTPAEAAVEQGEDEAIYAAEAASFIEDEAAAVAAGPTTAAEAVYVREQLAPLVGGKVTKARGWTFTVACVDGMARTVRFQRDPEGNPGTPGMFGTVPALKGRRLSTAGFEGMTITAASARVEDGDYGPEVWPTFALSGHGSDDWTVEVARDEEGNGAGWVHVGRGTRIKGSTNTTAEEATMTSKKSETKSSDKAASAKASGTTEDTVFIAHVWVGGKVAETKDYKTEAGAVKYAEGRAAEDAVKEVTITQIGSTRKLTVTAKGVKETTTRKPATDTRKKAAAPKAAAPRAAKPVDGNDPRWGRSGDAKVYEEKYAKHLRGELKTAPNPLFYALTNEQAAAIKAKVAKKAA